MESKTLPTAEEYFDVYAFAHFGHESWFSFVNCIDTSSSEIYEHQLIASKEYAVLFAKHHRKEMIEAIKEKARVKKIISTPPINLPFASPIRRYVICKESIENAYPEDLIQ